jgi:hypothetical protein
LGELEATERLLCCLTTTVDKTKTKLRGLQSASELYRPSDRRLSAMLVPTLTSGYDIKFKGGNFSEWLAKRLIRWI